MNMARILCFGLCVLAGCAAEGPLLAVFERLVLQRSVDALLLQRGVAALPQRGLASGLASGKRGYAAQVGADTVGEHETEEGPKGVSGPPVPLPNALLGEDCFLGTPDQWMRERLLQRDITAIKKGSGGRSLAFKLTFADGTQGYYKPAQSFSGANWYAEVAAYHLDRALGLGRVPPVVSRRMSWEQLRPSAGKDYRVPEIHVEPDGTVRGALVYWLDGPLAPAATPAGFENWFRVDKFQPWALSPYKRPAAYRQDLRDNKRRVRKGQQSRLYFETPPEADGALAAALSDMVIFDYLTLNIDRWGGQNGNVLTHGADQQLIFLDNGAGFSLGPPTRSLMDARLELLQRFRRSTVAALKRFSLSDFERRLDAEELAPVMGRELRAGVAIRRALVLDHIAAMEARHGDQVYSW